MQTNTVKAYIDSLPNSSKADVDYKERLAEIIPASILHEKCEVIEVDSFNASNSSSRNRIYHKAIVFYFDNEIVDINEEIRLSFASDNVFSQGKRLVIIKNIH